MSDLSSYLGNKIVRWLGGNAMPTAPATLYCALFDGNPKSGGTEVTTVVRAAGRLAIPWTVPAAGTGMVLVNSGDVDFGGSDGDTDITHVAVYDDPAAGNLLASKALSSPKVVLTGAPVSIAAGDLSITAGSAT